MYGGEDRKNNAEILKKDNEFIVKTTRSFSSREHAAEGYVERGFEMYSQNKFDKAMQCFNQAWLLNPDNAYIYLGYGLNLTMNQRSVPFTHVIGAGNQAVLGVPEFIDALLEDVRVKVIAIYVEGLSDVNAFARSAMRALEKGVPIVAIKVGSSDLGARQASSHTSSLVGADGLYDALFKRTGVIRVPSLNALLETAKMLSVCGPLAGRKMTSMSCSGGEATMMADLADRFGLELPDFSKAQYIELKKLMADFVTISNPLDYNTSIWGKYEAMRDCFATVMAGDFDVNCLIYDYPTIPFNKEVAEWDHCLDAYIEARKQTGKAAVVITTISELIPETARTRMIEGGVVPLQGTEEAMIAISSAYWYGQRRAELLSNSSLPRPAPASKPYAAPKVIDEATSKKMLAGYGLCIPKSEVVRGCDAALSATKLGYPVVLKAVGENLAHKTELGAVALNLKSANEVDGSVLKIMESISHIEGVEDKFLVENMINGTIAELIVGVKRDDQFGPVLVVGAGGILVELMNDSQTLLLPVDRASVKEAIQSLKSFNLLDGFRGAEKADMDAIIDAIMAVVDFTMDHWDQIEELDINPLMVGPKGVGAIAADALILMNS